MRIRDILIIMFLLSIFSCRTTPENERVERSTVAIVGIKANGIDWEKSPISARADAQSVSAWGG